MKKYWVWLALLFLLVSCSKTSAPDELNTQNATQNITRYVSLNPVQVSPGDIVTANVYDVDPSQIVYAHAMVGRKGAPLTKSPITGSIKFRVPEGLELGWQSVKIGIVGPNNNDYSYKGNYEYYEYAGSLKIISTEPTEPDCVPTPTHKCPNNDWDGTDPSQPEPQPQP